MQQVDAMGWNPGKWDKCLGSLHERGLFTHAHFTALNRMFWKLRSVGSDQTQATLKLIMHVAGVGRDAVIEATRRAVEFGLMVKVAGQRGRNAAGEWRGGNITYIYRIPDELPEPEVVIAVVKLPEKPTEIVLESGQPTAFLKVSLDSSLLLYPREYPEDSADEGSQEDAQGHAASTDGAGLETTLARPDASTTCSAPGDDGGPAEPVGLVSRGSPADSLGRSVPDRDRSDAPDLPRDGRANTQAMGRHPHAAGEVGSCPADDRGRRGLSDLLKARAAGFLAAQRAKYAGRYQRARAS